MGGVNDNGDSGVKTADINVIPKALRERNIVVWKLLNRVASNVTSLLTPYTFYSRECETPVSSKVQASKQLDTRLIVMTPWAFCILKAHNFGVLIRNESFQRTWATCCNRVRANRWFAFSIRKWAKISSQSFSLDDLCEDPSHKK